MGPGTDQIAVSVDHPLKDYEQYSFPPGARIAIAAVCAAGKSAPAPDRDRAARLANKLRGWPPTEPADDGSRSLGTQMPILQTNQSHETRPV